MQTIEALLLEPVGCLAEFPSAPFHEIAVRVFGRKRKTSSSASRIAANSYDFWDDDVTLLMSTRT